MLTETTWMHHLKNASVYSTCIAVKQFKWILPRCVYYQTKAMCLFSCFISADFDIWILIFSLFFSYILLLLLFIRLSFITAPSSRVADSCREKIYSKPIWIKPIRDWAKMATAAKLLGWFFVFFNQVRLAIGAWSSSRIGFWQLRGIFIEEIQNNFLDLDLFSLCIEDANHLKRHLWYAWESLKLFFRFFSLSGGTFTLELIEGPSCLRISFCCSTSEAPGSNSLELSRLMEENLDPQRVSVAKSSIG